MTLWRSLTGGNLKLPAVPHSFASELTSVTQRSKLSDDLFCARQVCERMMPGYGEQMRAISLRWGPGMT